MKTGGAIGAILFAFGLIAVITLKLNLFTGKAQFVWSPVKFRVNDEGSYSWLFSILFLNIIGCAMMGLLMSSPELQESAMTIIEKRLSSSPLRNGILAIGCGFIMTLAVQGAAANRWLPLLFGIPAFILCGFPHCVADAYYIASLPADFIAGRGTEIAIFYAAIVAGNFIGCNTYRLLQPAAVPASQTTRPSEEPIPAKEKIQ